MKEFVNFARWFFVLFAGVVLLTQASLSAFADEFPKEVRIAAVAYSLAGGKSGYNGIQGIVAKDGWLQEELQKRGIKLTWVPVAAQSVGATVNEAFASHKIDFAGYGDLPSIILNAGGIETRVVLPGGHGNNVYLVVPPGSSARSIADLKGKRIALHRGRPWEITFGRLVAANGLKLSDFQMVNLNPGAGAAALAAGDVDAFVTLDDAYKLEDKKIGKIIWSTKKEGQDWKMRAELWAAKDFVDKYPDITQLVVTAHVKAAYWISQDANFNAYIKLADESGHPEDQVRREYANDTVSWKQQWSPLYEDRVLDHYLNAVSYSRQTGLIRNDVNVPKLFEPRFLSAALKELRLENYWSSKKSDVVGALQLKDKR